MFTHRILRSIYPPSNKRSPRGKIFYVVRESPEDEKYFVIMEKTSDFKKSLGVLRSLDQSEMNRRKYEIGRRRPLLDSDLPGRE